MKKILLLFIGFTIILTSCTKYPQFSNNPFFTLNDVKNSNDNILRKEISFNTTSQVECYIEYWSKTDKSDLQHSRVSKKSLEHSITLILLKENSTYNYQIKSNEQQKSKILSFKTEALDKDIKDFIVSSEINDQYSFDGYILYSNKTSDYLLIIDNKANIVWYERFAPKFNVSCNFNEDTQMISFIDRKSVV